MPGVADLPIVLIDAVPGDLLAFGRRAPGDVGQGGRVQPAGGVLAPDERAHEAEPDDDDRDGREVPHRCAGPYETTRADARFDLPAEECRVRDVTRPACRARSLGRAIP